MEPTLSGTGTPAPGALPNATQSPLLSFADSLDAAVNLARTKRNKSSLDIMSPYRGTVAASDFNSILGNLNAASDRTSGDLIKRATDVTQPDILTTTNDAGVVTGIDKATGKVVWTTPPGTGNVQGGKKTNNVTNQVLDGFVSFGKLTPTDQASVRADLYEMGFGDDIAPIWFKKYIEDELRASLVPEKLTEEWIKYRDSLMKQGGGDADLDAMIESAT